MQGFGCHALVRCNDLSYIMVSDWYIMDESGSSEILTHYTFVKNYHRHTLWVILAFLFALDILTTTICLQQGGLEKNAYMIPFVDNPFTHGIIKLSAYILLFFVIELAVLFIQVEQPDKKTFWIKMNFVTLYGLIIFTLIYLIWLYFYVLINNIQIIS